MWDRLCGLLTDFDFLQARLGVADGLRRSDPPCTVFDVLRDCLAALRSLPEHHPGRAAVAALHRALDADSHVLKESPDLLVQQAHNALTREWGEGTALGRGVREAAGRLARPWLRRLNWPQADACPALRRTLAGHKGKVTAVAFHPGGQVLASHGEDEVIRLWDVRSGEERASLTDPRLKGTSDHKGRLLAFYADGKLLASVGRDGPLLWDPGNGVLVRALGPSPDGFGSRRDILVAFSPDGTRLLTGGSLHDYCWWDARTGAAIRDLSLGYIAGYSSSRDLSPDGALFASATGGLGPSRVEVRDAETFEPRWAAELVASAVAFSPDGETLAAGDYGGKLTLFAARTGDVLAELAGSRSLAALAFSPDGRLLAAGDEEGATALWDVGRAERVQTLLGHGRPVDALAFSPDGALLASGDADGAVRIWDVTSGAAGAAAGGHDAPVTAAAFSRDGALLASGCSAAGHNTAEVKLWDAGTGRAVRDLRTGSRRMLDWVDYEYEGRPADVNVLAFSHAGDRVAEGADDGSLRVWDVSTGAVLSSACARHNGRVVGLLFAPDDRTLVYRSSAEWAGNLLDLYDLRRGESRPLTGGVGPLAFSPDGTLLAVASPEGAVRLWEAPGGAEAGRFDPGKPVAALAFSADGRHLSATASDGEVRAWDVRTGERADAGGTLPSPTPAAWRPVWKGRRLEIRETRTDALLAWGPFDHPVKAVWVAPAGRRLRVADDGGSSRRPNIHLLELVGVPGGAGHV